MAEVTSQQDSGRTVPQHRPRGRRALLQKHRWLTYLLPLLVFMLFGGLEPGPPQASPDPGAAPPHSQTAPDGSRDKGLLPSIPYRYYPLVYTAKIVLTLAAILFVLPGYAEFPLRAGPLAVAVGVLGVGVWVGLCKLGLEQRLLAPMGLSWLVDFGARSAFNPLEQLRDHPAWAWGFLAIRFLGLVAVVAVIEEFFLRGFLMRFVMRHHWWEVPFGEVNAAAVAVGTVVPMAMHPGELLAAAAWFLMVTWLMVKTRNIWDCVVAHAVTNLLLGVYVVITGEWQLM